jgi:hypothetical protein
MRQTRRRAVATLFASGALAAAQQDPLDRPPRRPLGEQEEEPRLPNGKAQRDAIAKKQHEDALKDAEQLVTLAEEIREDIKKAGDFTVPIPALRRTEEIEKLARKIRGRLKS